MQTEFEATFAEINKLEVRKKLQAANASLLRHEFMQRRTVYHLPSTSQVKNGWMRVRDEGDGITMSIKSVLGDKIDDQKEICLTVDSFEEANSFLQALGCTQKAYQETLRELWLLDGVEITIDTWPFLKPFVEVEGESESTVKTISEKVGFTWKDAKFCAVDQLYHEQYGIPRSRLNNETPLLTFDMSDNPFT